MTPSERFEELKRTCKKVDEWLDIACSHAHELRMAAWSQTNDLDFLKSIDDLEFNFKCLMAMIEKINKDTARTQNDLASRDQRI